MPAPFSEALPPAAAPLTPPSLAGRAPRLQEVGMQHSQFAAEEHAAVDHGLFTDSVAYWSRQWAQLGPALVRHRELPCACHGASPLVPPAIRSERVALGAIIANALTQMCRTRNLTTFAVFSIASAASTMPTRPRVSIMPRASPISVLSVAKLDDLCGPDLVWARVPESTTPRAAAAR